MDRLRFNLGNSGILESTREYLGMTWESYGNDSGMTREYLGDSGRVQDMSSLGPPGSSPMEEVVGRWRLVTEVDRRPDGDTRVGT